MKVFKVHPFPAWRKRITAVVVTLMVGLGLETMAATGIEGGGGCNQVLNGMPALVQASKTTGETRRPGIPAPKKDNNRWNLADAAAPFRGMTVTVSFLPRPGYEAAIKLIPEFEKMTGINVEWESIYYEKMREALVLNFTSGKARFDVILIDIVWIGEFAAAGWSAPLAQFYKNSELADPDLDLQVGRHRFSWTLNWGKIPQSKEIKNDRKVQEGKRSRPVGRGAALERWPQA